MKGLICLIVHFRFSVCIPFVLSSCPFVFSRVHFVSEEVNPFPLQDQHYSLYLSRRCPQKIASLVGGGNPENVFEVEAGGSDDNCVILASLLGGKKLSSSSSFSRLLFELETPISISSVKPVCTSYTSLPTTVAPAPSTGGGKAPAERTDPKNTSPWAP